MNFDKWMEEIVKGVHLPDNKEDQKVLSMEKDLLYEEVEEE
jgi:hypothetical protein